MISIEKSLGKGRGGKHGLNLLQQYEDLKITLITLPPLHESMVASAIPLPMITIGP